MKWTDLKAKLNATPGYREAYEREFPDEALSLAVAHARARFEMDEREFARHLGISLKALRRLESGNLGISRLPTADEVRGILA